MIKKLEKNNKIEDKIYKDLGFIGLLKWKTVVLGATGALLVIGFNLIDYKVSESGGKIIYYFYHTPLQIFVYILLFFLFFLGIQVYSDRVKKPLLFLCFIIATFLSLFLFRYYLFVAHGFGDEQTIYFMMRNTLSASFGVLVGMLITLFFKYKINSKLAKFLTKHFDSRAR